MMTLAPSQPAPLPPEPAVDEAALIGAALEPGSRAFDQLVHLHSRRIFSFLLHLTRHRQDAEDLTQQTFIKAFHNLHRFDHSRPLINWLFTIARRTALNHFRATRRWEEMPDEIPAGDPSPAREVEQHDQHDTLWARARRVLSPREFEVLWLRFGEELSTEETARVTGLTQTHVKVIVHRARQHMLRGESAP